MKKNKGLIIGIILIILLIITVITLVLSMDNTAHLYFASFFFVAVSILLLIPLIKSLYYVVFKHGNNNTVDKIKKKSSIIKKALVGLIVLLWLTSGFCLVIKFNITPKIMPSSERLSNKISRSYTDEELDEIKTYILVDIWEVSPISTSFLDINTINSKYPIEALKYFFGNYYVYYQSENYVLQLVFDYVGHFEHMWMMEIKGNSEDADKIKIGDKSEDVKQYFSTNADAMEYYFYKVEKYATQDDHIIIVYYKNDSVIRVSKIPI